jgi:hypothetical protein
MTPAASVSGERLQRVIKDELAKAHTNSVDACRSGHPRSESYWDGYASGLRFINTVLEAWK